MTQKDFWRDLFQRRPELTPPGYEETVKSMGYKVNPTPPTEQPTTEECTVEF